MEDIGLVEAQESLADKFLQYFDIVLANSDEQKAETYGVRFRVYCEEFAYEDSQLFPDRQEKDEFDASSLHALVIHRSSGKSAGCVRLVAPDSGQLNGLLPFEKNCVDSLDPDFIGSLDLNRGKMCEISRLAVDGEFRRRSGERRTRFGQIDAMDYSKQERRTFSVIAVACFLAATALIDLTDRNSVFAMMEPFLPRMLKRSGLAFARAGQDIDYHGVRAPYFIDRPQDKVSADLMQLYSEIHRKIKKDYKG